MWRDIFQNKHGKKLILNKTCIYVDIPLFSDLLKLSQYLQFFLRKTKNKSFTETTRTQETCENEELSLAQCLHLFCAILINVWRSALDFSAGTAQCENKPSHLQ